MITTPDPYGVFGDSGRNDLTACKGFVQFRLTGPGVSVYTTLDYGDSTSELYPATFQPGATYTIQDDNNIAGTRRSITVATSGSAALVPSTSSKAGSNLRGTLAGTLSATGKLSLALDGKPVSRLKAGRYKITVLDRAPAQGAVVRESGHAAITLSGVAFVGSHSVTVALAAGQWAFSTSAGKSKTAFTVVA